MVKGENLLPHKSESVFHQGPDNADVETMSERNVDEGDAEEANGTATIYAFADADQASNDVGAGDPEDAEQLNISDILSALMDIRKKLIACAADVCSLGCEVQAIAHTQKGFERILLGQPLLAASTRKPGDDKSGPSTKR